MFKAGMRRNATIVIAAVAVLAAVGCVPQPDGGSPPASGSCSALVEVPLSDGSGWASPGSVSADGNRVAFIRDGRIIVREVVSGDDRDITGDLARGLPFASLKISSDGERVGVTLPGIDRADRDGFVIDVVTGDVTQLDWSEAWWPEAVYPIGFSGDLSTFVFWQVGTPYYKVVPSDGAPIYSPKLSTADYGTRLNDDATVIGARAEVRRGGTINIYPGPERDTASVVDLNRSGSRALVSTAGLAYFWDLDSGEVEALPTAPGEVSNDGGWARASDDGRFIVRDGTLEDGSYGVWRFDRSTGEVTPLPSVFDGVTGISDDGRVITSTNASYFRCTD